jgi:hypothetical protein
MLGIFCVIVFSPWNNPEKKQTFHFTDKEMGLERLNSSLRSQS